jgi:hypothetical protein
MPEALLEDAEQRAEKRTMAWRAQRFYARVHRWTCVAMTAQQPCSALGSSAAEARAQGALIQLGRTLAVTSGMAGTQWDDALAASRTGPSGPAATECSIA